MAVHPPTSRLVLGIGAFIIVGVPLVAYLWESLNQLFSGDIQPRRLLIALPVAVLLYLLLRFLSRSIQSWDSARPTSADPEM